MNRIRLWPLKRDDHSGALIGQRACGLMTLARESIDSPRAKSDRLHVGRDKWQLAATSTHSMDMIAQVKMKF